NTCCDSFRVTDQCSPCATTHQSYTGPEVWRYFQLATVAVVQFSHTTLTDRIHRFELGLSRSDGGIIDILNQFFRCRPSLFIGFTHNHVQTDTVAQFTTLSGCLGTDIFNFFFHGSRWFTPGQVSVHLIGGQLNRIIRRATEPERRMWLLYRWIEEFGIIDT